MVLQMYHHTKNEAVGDRVGNEVLKLGHTLSGLSIFKHGLISIPDPMSCDNIHFRI